MLFKVEIKVLAAKQFEGSYPVRKVCEDEDIMGMFELLGSELTPTKVFILGVLRQLPFTGLNYYTSLTSFFI